MVRVWFDMRLHLLKYLRVLDIRHGRKPEEESAVDNVQLRGPPGAMNLATQQNARTSFSCPIAFARGFFAPSLGAKPTRIGPPIESPAALVAIRGTAQILTVMLRPSAFTAPGYGL